jgi:hypothetical protein
MAQWIGYGLIGIFAVLSLFLLVVVPMMFKWAAVAFARVLVVETTNLLTKSGIASQVSNAVASVNKASTELTKSIQAQNQKQISRDDFEIRVIEEVK